MLGKGDYFYVIKSKTLSFLSLRPSPFDSALGDQPSVALRVTVGKIALVILTIMTLWNLYL